jgi:hypothetical protein
MFKPTYTLYKSNPGEPEFKGLVSSIWTVSTRLGRAIGHAAFWSMSRSDKLTKASHHLITAHINILEAHKILSDLHHSNDGVSPKAKKLMDEANKAVEALVQQ